MTIFFRSEWIIQSSLEPSWVGKTPQFQVCRILGRGSLIACLSADCSVEGNPRGARLVRWRWAAISNQFPWCFLGEREREGAIFEHDFSPRHSPSDRNGLPARVPPAWAGGIWAGTLLCFPTDPCLEILHDVYHYFGIIWIGRSEVLIAYLA